MLLLCRLVVRARNLVILARKFVVVSIGALVSNEPQFAAVITTVSLFVAYVLQVAYNPYRTSNGFSALPNGDAVELTHKLKLR